jgi:hypothetical protein
VETPALADDRFCFHSRSAPLLLRAQSGAFVVVTTRHAWSFVTGMNGCSNDLSAVDCVLSATVRNFRHAVTALTSFPYWLS